MIENIVWIMTGSISALGKMGLAWRIANGQATREKMNYGSKSIAMEKVKAQRT
jgi:hypothetical protein